MVDRPIVYPGAVPLDTDILSTNRNIMLALGYALRATIGGGPVVDGLACLPTVPASMQITVGQGSIIATSTVDASAYGTIAADNADPLVKMGINPFGSTSFTLTAPGTSGQSINYLIEAQLVEADGLPVALPYFNASNPSQPFTGPNNNQAQQNTVRTQRVGLQLKAGAAAGAGSQQTPAVDAGWVGLYIITINFAQTTITATSITVYPNAPFIAAKIPALAPLVSPPLQGTPTAPTPTVGDNSTKLATTAFISNYLAGGGATATTPSSGDVSNKIATTAFVTAFGHAPQTVSYTTSQNFTVPVGVFRVKATVVGSGASGGGTSATGAGQISIAAGGNSGAIGIGVYNVTPGQVIPITVGTGVLWSLAGGGTSVNGNPSSFGSFLIAPGGGGPGVNVPAVNPPVTQAPAPASGFRLSTGGTISNSTDSSAQAAIGMLTGNFLSGAGADCQPYGVGGGIVATATANGITSTGFGGGGGGGATGPSSAGSAGGPSTSGIVVLEW